MRPVDVQSATRANHLRSALLVLVFPFVLPTLLALIVLCIGLFMGRHEAVTWAASTWLGSLLAILAVTLIWLPIGYLLNQWVIDRSMRARLVAPQELPRLWAIFEPLCNKAGIRQPALRIIETDALNAYASGLREGSYSVTVTRGLLDTLDDDELEGVLAHELTHIINHDVRLLVIATVLVGIIPMVHDVLMRMFWGLIMFLLTIYRGVFSLLPSPGAKALTEISYAGLYWVGRLVAYAVGFLGTMCSLVIHFALSRRREFMADAGAAEITGKPEALIGALRKISGTHSLEVTLTGMRAMLFESPAFGWGGLMATHPPIEARIAALQEIARSLPSPSDTLGRYRATAEPEEGMRPQSRKVQVDTDEPSTPTWQRVLAKAPHPSERQEPVLSLGGPDPHRPDPSMVARFVALLSAGRPAELTPAEREQLYRRARQALDTRKNTSPPMPAAQIAMAEQCLEEAIVQIERSL